jgi:hypothetical protein
LLHWERVVRAVLYLPDGGGGKEEDEKDDEEELFVLIL